MGTDRLTVAVTSEAHMSQMYLMPPSVVLTAVFFLMSPMMVYNHCCHQRGGVCAYAETMFACDDDAQSCAHKELDDSNESRGIA